MSSADLSAAFERRLGKKLSAKGLAQVQALLNEPELASDQGKFTSRAMHLLGPGLKPQDSRHVAKVLESFWKASISKVDTEKLLHDIIAKNLSPSQAVAVFGAKQAGRFEAASRYGIGEFEKYRKEIVDVPEDYPARIAGERMAGISGAMGRLRSATEKLGVAFVDANEQWLLPTINKATELVNAFSRLDAKTLETVTALGSAVVGLGTFAAVLKGLKFLGVPSAGGAAAAAGGMVLGATPALAGAAGLTLLGAKPLNAGEDEMARQRRYGEGPFQLGNAPPESGRFTPWPGGKAPRVQLEGAARLAVDMNIRLDPGLIADEIQKSSRNDTGISMKP